MNDLTQPMLPFYEPKARRADPKTSHAAATAVSVKAGSQRARLLMAFADHAPHGLTDEEAAIAAGISLVSEYATRCSELRNSGLLDVCLEPITGGYTQVTRVGSSGMARIVSAITDDGYAIASRLRPVERAS